MTEQPTQPFPAQGPEPTGRRPRKKREHPRRWPWAVGAFIAGLALASSGGSSGDSSKVSSAPAPTVTVTAAPAAAAAPAPAVTVTAPVPPPVTVTAAAAPAPAPAKAASKASVGNGQWLVGKDIEPGTYRSPGVEAGDLCYADTNDGAGNINQQEVTPEGPTVITVSSKDKVLKVSGCEDFVLQ
jgi:hypothetical protein